MGRKKTKYIVKNFPYTVVDVLTVNMVTHETTVLEISLTGKFFPSSIRDSTVIKALEESGQIPENNKVVSILQRTIGRKKYGVSREWFLENMKPLEDDTQSEPIQADLE